MLAPNENVRFLPSRNVLFEHSHNVFMAVSAKLLRLQPFRSILPLHRIKGLLRQAKARP